MWLIGVAVLSFVLVLRPVAEGLSSRRARSIGLRVLISRFGLSALCYLGVGSTGVLLSVSDYNDALSGLLMAVVLLLVVAVRNTWDLLVTVADRPDRSDRPDRTEAAPKRRAGVAAVEEDVPGRQMPD